jgi:hypothetical protein
VGDESGYQLTLFACDYVSDGTDTNDDVWTIMMLAYSDAECTTLVSSVELDLWMVAHQDVRGYIEDDVYLEQENLQINWFGWLDSTNNLVHALQAGIGPDWDYSDCLFPNSPHSFSDGEQEWPQLECLDSIDQFTGNLSAEGLTITVEAGWND